MSASAVPSAEVLVGQTLADFRGIDVAKRPCRIKYDYLKPKSGCIAVKRGALGVVSEFQPKGSMPMILLRIVHERDIVRGQSATGWVPAQVVEISLSAIYGELQHMYVQRPIVLSAATASLPLGITSKDCKLVRIITKFFETLLAESQSALLFKADLAQAIKDQSSLVVAREIVKGISDVSEGLLEVLNRDSFTYKDIRNAAVRGPRSGHNTVAAGNKVIYMLDYPWVDANDKRSGLYIGKTADEYMRLAQHQHQISVAQDPSKKGATHHYRRAARLGDGRMFILGSYSDDTIHDLAEQALISVFDSYATFLKTAAEQSSDIQTVVTVGPNESLEDALQDLANQQGSESKDQYTAAGVFMIKTMMRAKEGFTWGFRSPIVGLNVESPGTLSRETIATLWSRIDTPTMSIYRRSKMQVRKGTGDLTVFSSRGKMLSIAIKSFRNLQIDSWIYPSIEIMKQGSHEVPFARLPTVGPYENWERARAVAVALTYKDQQGNWQKCYSARGESYKWARDDNNDLVPGALTPYVTVTGIRRYLEQEVVTNLPSWADDWGVANVVNVSFRHSTQTVIGTTCTPGRAITLPLSSNGKSTESFKSKTGIIDDLVREGFRRENIALPHGTQVAGVQKPRRTCDFCFLTAELVIQNGQRSWGDRKMSAFTGCRPVEGRPNICRNTRQFGMPMIFTPSVDLGAGPAANERRRDALTVRRPADIAPVRVADPRLNVGS